MKTPFGSPVLDVVSRLMAPFIFVFSFYVLVHGHDSPGGGFQSGTLLAAVFILLHLVRGHPGGPGPVRAAAYLSCAGVGVYALMGLWPLLAGSPFLDYGVLPFPLAAAQKRAFSIFIVETGIAAGVMGVLLAIFFSLIEKPR